MAKAGLLGSDGVELSRKVLVPQRTEPSKCDHIYSTIVSSSGLLGTWYVLNNYVASEGINVTFIKATLMCGTRKPHLNYYQL